MDQWRNPENFLSVEEQKKRDLMRGKYKQVRGPGPER
jgi:hypothetical protein